MLWLAVLTLSKRVSVPRHSVLFRSFTPDDWESSWIRTNASNYTGIWERKIAGAPQGLPGEQMLYATTKNAHHAISTYLIDPLDPAKSDLVIQYEVRFQNGASCSGGYIKLFPTTFRPTELTNETDYILLFGPDRCTKEEIKFILRDSNENKMLTNPPGTKPDPLTNAYTLIIRTNNSFEIRINDKKVRSGDFLTDFDPPVIPPEFVDDPSDKKPSDWDDRPYIVDESAVKPADWNESEPEFVPDPEQLDVPEGWLLDEPRYIPEPGAKRPKNGKGKKKGQGKSPTIANPRCLAAIGCGPYTPPLVRNPRYKGVFQKPMIPNPRFKGAYKPRQVQNPRWSRDAKTHQIPPIGGLGIEILTVDGDVGFNNLLITTDEKQLRNWNRKHYLPKREVQEERSIREMANLPQKEPPSEDVDLDEIIGLLADAIVALLYRFPSIAIFLVVLLVKGPVWMFRTLCCCGCCRQKPPPKEEEPEKVKDLSHEEKAKLKKEIRQRRSVAKISPPTPK
jgi:calnexin